VQKPNPQNGHSPEKTVVIHRPSHQDHTRVVNRTEAAASGVESGWRGFAPEGADHNEQTQFHVREGFTEIIHDMLEQPERETQRQITGVHLLVGLLLVLTLAARLANIQFNTLYLDEAIYTTVGEDVRAGVFDQGATSWMFGSYLYPVIASSIEQLGGVTGLRILSAILTTSAAVFVYMAAKRLFDNETALWTLLLFGLSGISISLGQQAVLDVLGVPLLALSVYWIVLSFRSERRQSWYFMWAGFTFSLSVLAKYIALLYLPALVLLIVTLHLWAGRSLLSVITRIRWISFFVPMVIVLGIYGAFYFNDLMAVMSGQFASQSGSRGVILWKIIQDVGVPILLAVFGMVLIGWKTVQRFYPQRVGLLVILLPVLALLMAAVLILPLYHILAANERSMWKHNVYTLIFLAPLAGYAIARTIQAVRWIGQKSLMPFRFVSAGITIVALIWFSVSALRQNDALQRSWPNNVDELAFIQTQNITPQSRILSPSYAIYEYYFDMGVDDRDVWNNVWYTEYGTSTGTDAIRQSIQECSYDLIVLDNYYAPEWAGTLEPLVQEAGYVIVHNTLEEISTGDTIITNIYKLPEGSGCKGTV
jgi:hypothetical protein